MPDGDFEDPFGDEAMRMVSTWKADQKREGGRMSHAAMILGPPGSGKSTSIRNLDPAKSLVLQCLPKPLPFPDARAWAGSVLSVDQRALEKKKAPSDYICDCIRNAHKGGKEVIIVDDAQYLIANEFMRKANVAGWGKFTEMARHAWDVMMAAVGAHETTRVYLLWHTTTDDQGNTRAKTIGKLLDEKIFVEGMLTIVLRAYRDGKGQYVFRTQTDGSDTCKSPMGLFAEEEIPNDLAAVDAAICDYYQIPTTTGATAK